MLVGDAAHALVGIGAAPAWAVPVAIVGAAVSAESDSNRRVQARQGQDDGITPRSCRRSLGHFR